MKHVWNWLKANSTALQGLAALVVIIGAVITVPAILWHTTRPDILVRFSMNQDTTPVEVEKWSHDASRLVINLEDEKKLSTWTHRRLGEISKSVSKKLSAQDPVFDRVKLEVINQSGSVITGIRLRLNHVYSPWGAKARAAFLSNSELQSFDAKLESAYREHSMIFPELPPLPPDTSFTILVFGDLDGAEVAVTTQGQSTDIKKIVEVENVWVVDWYRHPYKLFPAIFLIPILFVLSIPVWTQIRQRVIRNETPNILYNAACEKALDGQPQEAIALLKESVRRGYTNHDHMMKDDDLQSLRNMDDFKDLIEKMKGSD